MTENVKLNLDENDFKFVDWFSKKYKIPAGYGYKNNILRLITEYKIFNNEKKGE